MISRRTVHIAARRRGGSVAARGARAAGRADAAHRRTHDVRSRRSGGPGPVRGVSAGAAAVGSDRRAQRAHRHPLGRKQCRRHSSTRDRIGRARARRDPRQWRAATGPLLQATRTVPIVFAVVADPVGAGFVDSLSRPGGNATGFSLFEYGIGAKWLELLKQIEPRVTRVAVIRDPALPPEWASSARSSRWRRRLGSR